jgi:hypothetical protein
MWNDQGTECTYSFPSDGKVNNFQAVQWISECCQKFHYDIVVTSTWRMRSNYKECLLNGGLRPGIEILGCTDDLWNPNYHTCRGTEISQYLEDHPEINYYMIIDDEDDILPGQEDHFIQTNGDVGFCLADFTRFEKIYLQDLEHGGSFPDRKNKDYRRMS